MRIKHSAFSLIEMSIVIAVVGILIAGIAQASKMIAKANLSSARTLTKQSIVNEMPDLVLWFETTLTGSIFVPPDNTQANYDGNSNLWWYDINPQAVSRSNAKTSWAIGGAPAQKPTYTENSINGLPALKCDGNDTAGVDGGTEFYPPLKPFVINSFTIFFVALATSTHEIDVQSNSGTVGIAGQKYVVDPAYEGTYGFSTMSGVGVSMGTNGVSVYEHSLDYMPALAVYNGSSGGLLTRPAIITIDYKNKTPTIYINSNTSVSGATSTMNTVVAPGGFCANVYGGFVGYIGEVIIFNRHLLTDERKAVEKYLSKKWKIDFS